MGNNKFTPESIVTNTITFSIPLYQRLFSWKKENVEKLLHDMKEHFEKSPKDPYYLGMLTCVQDGNTELLIDGQQRMTVTLLMAIAFCKKHYDAWNGFLSGGDRIKFIARDEDKKYIKWLIDNSNIMDGQGEKGQYKNTNMFEALISINDFLEKLGEGSKKFAENVFKQMTFFISRLPNNYSNNTTLLNKYFEAMNSQGKGLEQHEILKVELLKKMSSDNVSSNEDTLINIWNNVSQMDRPIIVQEEKKDIENYRAQYEKAIQTIPTITDNDWLNKLLENNNNNESLEDNTIKEIKPEKIDFNSTYRDEGTDSIITFEELLLMVLDITLDITNEGHKESGEDKEGNKMEPFTFYRTDKLLERFQNLINSKPNKIEKFYWNLLYYRLLMDYYVIRRGFANGEGRYTLLVKADDGDEKKLLQYQSMLYVSTEFYEWLKPYLKKLADEKTAEKNPKQLLEWLKKEDNKRHPPERMQPLSYPKVNRYWFWRLDYYLWEDRDNWCKDKNQKYKDAVSKYVFRPNRSIEHFHPQDENHNPSWEKEEVIHSFGNLAMISQSFNSQQNNDHLMIKFDRIYEQLDKKALQSIKLLKMCIHVNFDYSKWDEETATKHGEDMINVLEKSFNENRQDDTAEGLLQDSPN